MRWEKTVIHAHGGQKAAIAPLIVSASRATDLPAFFSDWFINRLRRGYSKWINPFNGHEQYISFSTTRFIVFWSKNPQPLIEHLPELDARGIHYYFQFTLNDYEHEGLEPNVPPLAARIRTFKKLSQTIGPQRMIWRFDPLILTDAIDLDAVLNKIKTIGDQIHNDTRKLVFSYLDVRPYRKVRQNLKKAGIAYREFDKASMLAAAKGIADLNQDWGLALATCGETICLAQYGIQHNQCIDGGLIKALCPHDRQLTALLGNRHEAGEGITDAGASKKKLKDKGQRKACGCIVSKDIGQYNSCRHLCRYCYANHSPLMVERNLKKTDPNSSSILGA